MEKGDFHLAAGSAGIDFGDDLTETVPVDIEGTKRPQGSGFDCGCYERKAEEGGGP
ncbi:MAG: choice-of-anchor Q domain-containing protein [Planctomycetota bacterium]